MVGFIVFWSIYLWGANKKRLFLAIIACGLIAIFASQKVETIFWQTGHLIKEHDLNAASSGRLTIWRHNLQIYLDSTILQKLFGHGLGSEGRKAAHFVAPFGASHNDYLSLLMLLGLIGLLIYLTLLASLLWDIYTCELDKRTKYLFLGIFASAAVMNFLSNAVIFRIELSQYFWLFMGFFYFAKEGAKAGKLSSTEPG
jgi:O-antigen ligase